MIDYNLKQISIQRLKYRNTRIKFFTIFFWRTPNIAMWETKCASCIFEQEVTDQRCSTKLSEV